MTFDYNILEDDEKLVFALRGLYYQNGYAPYKMSKFEDYDLYSKNKDFLISDSLITFTDTNGRLKALKPDVTLSIIKNYKDSEGLRKVCYNETVYRVSKGTGSFKELMQTGVECMGILDASAISGVLSLAAESMALVAENYVLEVSDLDILSSFVQEVSGDRDIQKQLLHCVGEKNVHGLKEIALQNNLDATAVDHLKQLVGLYGAPDKVLASLKELAKDGDQLALVYELEAKIKGLKGTKAEGHMILDFSLVNDMKYYNGITFQGFIEGIPDSMLSGGQYDRLMHRMGRKAGAIGFAVYLDALERLELPKNWGGEAK